MIYHNNRRVKKSPTTFFTFFYTIRKDSLRIGMDGLLHHTSPSTDDYTCMTITTTTTDKLLDIAEIFLLFNFSIGF